jgi:putative glycosyltransferase
VVRKQSKPKSSYTFIRLIRLALSSITAFSRKPLIIIAVAGMFILLLSTLYAIFVITIFFLYGDVPSGFTTLVLSIWFLGGLTIFSIGVVAIYLSVVYLEVKQRPYTIVRDVVNADDRTASTQSRVGD